MTAMAQRDADGEDPALSEARARIVALEAALEAARRTSDRADRMSVLGTMVAGVAHDINTPVGSIKANTDLIARALEMIQKAFETEAGQALLATEKKLPRALSILQQSNDTNKLAAARIIELVGSLRTFSRDAGDKEELDVHEALEATLVLLRHQLRKGVDIEKRYGSVPRCNLRPGQMSQVFMNVLVNAVQAMDGQGKITIETGVEDGAAVVRFSDTGRGIPAEALPKIFEAGFTTKSADAGTGLGLSICRRIVEEHDGTIECTSVVGTGSTFTVRLPCPCQSG
jgi:two-component system NtrC family sensor kinase